MISKVTRKIRFQIQALKSLAIELTLLADRSGEVAAFRQNSRQLNEAYSTMCDLDQKGLVEPFWQHTIAEMEKSLLPRPPFSFLRVPAVQTTMFVSNPKIQKQELMFLERQYEPARLREVLRENRAGRPLLSSFRYKTSANSIHHLHHLANLSDKTGTDLETISSVIEWGGGYGNLAKIFERIKKTEFTYTIIDVPLLGCLQWVYLATTLGRDRVHLVSESHGIEKNKINLLPLCYLEKAPTADLFISTWALSESSRKAQEYAVNMQWFGAKNLLIAGQASNKSLPNAGNMRELAGAAGAKVYDIEFLPGSYYAFK